MLRHVKVVNARNPTGINQGLKLLSYINLTVNFAKNTANLRALTREGVEFQFSKECEAEFESIKKRLIGQPVMSFPDFSRRFILTTDACKEGYGAILSQMYPDGERVIAYASKSTNEHEKNYSATELEAGAVVWAVDKFKLYLTDNPFDLVTDHKALTSFREISGVLNWKGGV